MIKLTRLNNQTLYVNCDLIKFVEGAPDTVLTLVNGEKVVVLESCDQVLAKVVEFRRSVLTARVPPFPSRSESPEASGEPDTNSKDY
jgi:flagellar protein FlbD